MMDVTPSKLERLSEAWPRIWPWVAGLAGVALLGGLFYFLATLGPRKVSGVAAQASRVELTAEQRNLSDAIGELRNKYQLQQQATSEPAGEAAMRFLDEAIAQQRKLLRLNPQAGAEQNARLDWLVAARATERAKLAVRRIAELETASAEDQKAGRAEAAVEKLREALQRQREVNNSGADAHWKNLVRETQLAQTLAAAEAVSIYHEFQTALQEARAAAAGQRWAEALAAFGRAREARAQLNQRYGRTQFADQQSLAAIDAEIDSLGAAAAVAEIDAQEKAADTAAEKGRAQEAAELYQKAGDMQRDLNEKFAGSRFVTTQRMEEFEIKRQTVLSAEPIAAVAALDHAAAASLLKRQVVAAGQKIHEAAALLKKAEAEYPKSRNFDGVLKIKLAYLGTWHDDIRKVQDLIYERLVPVPEANNVLMLKTEMPQEIYAKVMSADPSRNQGHGLPVDSVTWPDAQEFCQRLSWLLGTRVRLPSEREFRSALGAGDGPAWNAENAEGHSQEAGRQNPNAAGFYDLAGNVAEWLEPAGANAKAAPVAGGSYLDSPTVLKTFPVVLTDKTERARHIGFRVVVELAID